VEFNYVVLFTIEVVWVYTGWQWRHPVHDNKRRHVGGIL